MPRRFSTTILGNNSSSLEFNVRHQMPTLRLFVVVALLNSMVGCSLCNSYRVTGHFPEWKLLAPNGWPELRMNTSEANITLRYAYYGGVSKKALAVETLLTIDKNGAVHTVDNIETDDVELREKIRNALPSLRFYLRETEVNAVSRYPAPSNPKTDVQAPFPVSQSGLRRLPEQLSNVRVIVEFVYHDYQYRDNCWK